MISISFEARAETTFGQHVRVVGNFIDLGDWAPSLALELHTDEASYPIWKSRKEIRLPEGFDLEFKLVTMNNSYSISDWENLFTNRSYTPSISQNRVILKITQHIQGIEDFSIISTDDENDTSKRVLKNYTNILVPFRITSYPIIKKDKEFLAQKLEAKPLVQPTIIEQAQEVDDGGEENQQENIPSNSIKLDSDITHLKAQVNGEEAAAAAASTALLFPQTTEQGEEEHPLSEQLNHVTEIEDWGGEECNDIEYIAPKEYDKSGRIDYFYRLSLEQTDNSMQCSSAQKASRLKNELKQLSKSLPVTGSNAIIVLYDETRLDVMRAVIFGSEGTPYAHGAFIFDIYIPEEYPLIPPKVSIVSTKGDSIRFNPNLYADGLVCLSLLGTWQGDPQESWDPTCSSIYQVLLSIQSLVMCEDVYFNEPYYEHTRGTEHGDKCNRAYSNIVRYFNLTHTICDMIEAPPPEFEYVILMHFYLKRELIKADVQEWIEEAEKNIPCEYDELIRDHNYAIADEFYANPNEYHLRLVKEAKRLDELLEGIASRLNIQ